MKHIQHKCDRDDCMVCEGGLASCTVCKGGEGGLPTHCPGRPMTQEEHKEVYNGQLDFEDAQWKRARLVAKSPKPEFEVVPVIPITPPPLTLPVLDSPAQMAAENRRRDAEEAVRLQRALMDRYAADRPAEGWGLMDWAVAVIERLESDLAHSKEAERLRSERFDQVVDQRNRSAAAFKNFHRQVCDRVGYVHDDAYWWRDQVSLIEHIPPKS